MKFEELPEKLQYLAIRLVELNAEQQNLSSKDAAFEALAAVQVLLGGVSE